MASLTSHLLDIPDALLQAIRAMPREKCVDHCGRRWTVSPFDFNATCPVCGTRLKLRSFSSGGELEDVFDAVFEWMNQPGREELIARRRQGLAEEED